MVGSFRSVVGAAGLALAFSLAAVPAPVAAAEGVPSEAEIQDEGRLVTDTEGNALMVGASEYFGSVPHFRYRHAEGHWSREYDLPGVSFATEVRAASGRPHMPVVLFRPNAGRTYFAGVNFYEQLPAGYLGYLNAFRLQRP